MKLITFIICSVIIFQFNIFGQGEFLQSGKSGLGFSGGFSYDRDVNGYGLTAFYSFSGLVDFSLSYQYLNYKENLFGADFSGSDLSPSLNYHALKQNQFIPLSLSVNASYHSMNYSNSVLKSYYFEMTGDLFHGGLMVYKYYDITSAIKVQPGIGIIYVTGKNHLKDYFGQVVDQIIDMTLIPLELAFIFQTSPKTVLAIQPEIGISRSVPAWGLVITIIPDTD